MNIVRLLCLEFAIPNPLDSWDVKSVLKGIKREKGQVIKQKAPITISDLRNMYKKLCLDNLNHLQLWTGALIAFFGLLRLSNIIPPHGKSAADLSIKRSAVKFTSQGITLTVSKSKTIQYGSRTHEVILPFIPNNVLCPTSTLTTLLGKTMDVPPSSPILSSRSSGGSVVNMSQTQFRKSLRSTLVQIGFKK